MAKPKTVYSCTECGGQLPKWQGQCPHCGAWNTLVESVAAPAPTRFTNVAGARSSIRPLATVDAKEIHRIPTGLDEFDRVLGGGLVEGGVVLLGGDPGIGKSTLLLQACAVLGAARRTLYVTGEESVEQIAMRAQRLGLVNAPVELLAEVQLEAIVAAVGSASPEVVVVDSIQTMYLESVPSAAGSISQVRECALALLRTAKATGIPTFLATLKRTAFSFPTRESNDFATVLMDVAGNLIAQSIQSIPSFLATLPLTTQSMLERRPANAWREGDVMLTNDPWIGAGHLPDVSIVQPLFWCGRLVGFVGSITHVSDIGGTLFGGYTRELFEEGLRFPPTLIQTTAGPNETFFDVIGANTRVPDEVIGDFHAMMAANDTAIRNVRQLLDEGELGDLTEFVQYVQARSEAAI